MTHREQIAYRDTNELVADGWIHPETHVDGFDYSVIAKAPDSIYTLPLYAADNPAIVALVEALNECSGDLEVELQQRYNGILDYPSEAAKYKRDMAPVIAARAALAPWVKEKV